MALTSCHECGHQVSDEAPACPGCGAPMRAAIKKAAKAAAREKSKNVAVGRLALIGLAVVLVVVVMSFGESTEDQTRRREEMAAEATARKEALCTDEMNTAALALVADLRPAAGDVFVEPLLWTGLDYGEREGFGRWAAICLLDGIQASIRHGRTGKELATWSISWGYDPSD